MFLRRVNRSATVPAVLGALLLPALLVALPAAASGGRPLAEPTHVTLVRDTGMPTTSDPARTIGAADAWARPTAGSTTELSVSVMLSGVPTPDHAADLRIALGQLSEDGCAVVEEWVVRTDDATYADPAAPAGLVVTHAVAAGAASGSLCLVVSVTDPTDPAATALDRWTGAVERVVPLRAAPGQARIVDVGHTRLVPRTWSWVEVIVRVRFHGVTSIRLGGHGKDLRVQPVTVTGDFGKRERVLITLPVRLRAGEARTLRLDTAVAGVAQPLVDRERVRIRPR
ncbi:hypothetical protein [Nocardioides taihuensis]|uniref:Uncharacterized protein n=1 Tax=Nocardioides taihuensis TaxID=1835606 RepID=A0ABW0BJB9_9ACTN